MVYLFLADGFEEIEALTPADLLRRAGVTVTTVGVTGKIATGSHGISVTADVTAAEAQAMLKDGIAPAMVILPGGMPGAKNLDESVTVDEFIRAATDADAYLAAICAAPMILGKRGLLNGKRAVCYPGFEAYLNGASVQNVPCVRDGKIITGRAMGAATEFALSLVAALCGEEKADEIRKGVLA
ncbi:MAG: DJ-1/PfpI family protein [Clostridia bacterium]|nr:DJ-1/PfpI family protein [Clostridia bacterium]